MEATPEDQQRAGIRAIADELSMRLDDPEIDRQYIAEHTLWRLDTLLGQEPRAARVWSE